MIRRIGCRAHDYGKGTIEALTSHMASDGYTTTQLALKKAIDGLGDLENVLTEDFAKNIQKTMAPSKVDISVLGAYLNYAHPDESLRDKHIDILKKHLMYAKIMGAKMVGTETGSMDPGYEAHPDNHGETAFLRFKDAMDQVLPLAHEYKTYMAVEAVAHHIINTPERMYRLITEMDDDRLKVIFDINNLITAANYKEQDKMITDMFGLLGDRIMAIHVKDFDIVDGVKKIVPVGEGLLNLALLLSEANRSPVEVDVLAENIPKERLKDTFRILKEEIRSL